MYAACRNGGSHSPLLAAAMVSMTVRWVARMATSGLDSWACAADRPAMWGQRSAAGGTTSTGALPERIVCWAVDPSRCSTGTRLRCRPNTTRS